MIEVGHLSNYGKHLHLQHVYFSVTLDIPIWEAELARGSNLERIYQVKPTISYHSQAPLRVIGEILNWTGHDIEMVSKM